MPVSVQQEPVPCPFGQGVLHPNGLTHGNGYFSQQTVTVIGAHNLIDCSKIIYVKNCQHGVFLFGVLLLFTPQLLPFGKSCEGIDISDLQETLPTVFLHSDDIKESRYEKECQKNKRTGSK